MFKLEVFKLETLNSKKKGFSGRKSSPVPGEEYCIPDIFGSKHCHNKTFTSHAPACMRRHSIFESFKVELKAVRVQAL